MAMAGVCRQYRLAAETWWKADHVRSQGSHQLRGGLKVLSGCGHLGGGSDRATRGVGLFRRYSKVGFSPGKQLRPKIQEAMVRSDKTVVVLSRAYEASADSPQFQYAMLNAAQDLQERAPAVSLQCADAEGQPAKCSATEALLRSYAAASSEIGIRGALQKLLERVTGKGS